MCANGALASPPAKKKTRSANFPRRGNGQKGSAAFCLSWPQGTAARRRDVWKCRGDRVTVRAVYLRAFLFFLSAFTAAAQSDGSALGALKLLPKDAAKRLARIEARDAAPVPERWYFIVYDPALPRGMREFVVAGGKVAGSRELSQFAETVSPAEVVGGDGVKIDSDRVARLAAMFATANGGRVAAINFELARDPAANAPVWRATVLNPDGDQLGVLAVNAVKGAILSHDGFENEPSSDLLNAAQAGAGTASRNSAAGQKGGASQPSAARVVRPSPTPRTNLLKRFFGADGAKPPRSAQ